MFPETVSNILYSYRSMSKDRRTCEGGGLRELCKRFRDMARGGNGGLVSGDLENCGLKGLYSVTYAGVREARYLPKGTVVSFRQQRYPNHPISFFQKVCDGMGWSY